jgi:hypothetical protein
VVYSVNANYTDIAAAAAVTSKARIKLYGLIKQLQGAYQICLINTDEIIIAVDAGACFLKNTELKTKEIS